PRHGHATHLLVANTHPKVVQERLGHANIQLTLDTYSHVLPSMQEDAPLFRRLKRAAMEIKPVAVSIDTASDVFAGSELDRGHVTQFIKMLQGMAVRAECSVAILAHPSNAGMASGSGISGSTGWHNKVRARAYMRAIETPKGEEPDPDLREI